MSESDVEVAIARAQAKADQDKGLEERHKKSIGNLNERILSFILVLGIIGLTFVWSISTSTFLIYGSFLLVILFIILWGVIQIRRLEQIKEQRRQQAKDSQSTDRKFKS